MGTQASEEHNLYGSTSGFHIDSLKRCFGRLYGQGTKLKSGVW